MLRWRPEWDWRNLTQHQAHRAAPQQRWQTAPKPGVTCWGGCSLQPLPEIPGSFPSLLLTPLQPPPAPRLPSPEPPGADGDTYSGRSICAGDCTACTSSSVSQASKKSKHSSAPETSHHSPPTLTLAQLRPAPGLLLLLDGRLQQAQSDLQPRHVKPAHGRGRCGHNCVFQSSGPLMFTQRQLRGEVSSPPLLLLLPPPPPPSLLC